MHKPCQSCADKIIKMRELKRQRIEKLKDKQLQSNSASFSTIKDIINK